MRIIAWLLNKIKRTLGDTPADKRKKPDVVIRLEVKSHEVTDEEHAAIKIERKQKAKEWAALGQAEQRKRMRKQFADSAESNRKRSMSLGIKQYKWLAIPGVSCDIGLRNNGKIFSYEAPPPEGHPCEGKCNSEDWCRCTTIRIIPGFED